VYADLLAAGAVPRVVAPQLGQLVAADGTRIDVEISIEAGPPVLYDAVIVADGEGSAALLARDAGGLDFIRQQHLHCKPILAVGAGKTLLEKVGLSGQLEDGTPDPALWAVDAGALAPALEQFKQALASHRNFKREFDAAPL
jgi:catalase